MTFIYTASALAIGFSAGFVARAVWFDRYWSKRFEAEEIRRAKENAAIWGM